MTSHQLTAYLAANRFSLNGDSLSCLTGEIHRMLRAGVVLPFDRYPGAASLMLAGYLFVGAAIRGEALAMPFPCA